MKLTNTGARPYSCTTKAVNVLIDLHTHSSLSKKNGDSIKLESNFEALKIFKKNNVKIAAFTDHNTFSAQGYLEMSSLAKKMNILFLPGIELDVIRKNDKRGNIIVILSNTISKKTLVKLENVVRIKAGKRKIRISKFEEMLNGFEYLTIPHVGKSDYCTYEDLSGIKVDAIEITNKKHPNFVHFQKLAKKSNTKYSVVAWSDTHNWRDYPQNRKLYTQIENVHSYDDLKKAFSQNKDYVKEKIYV